MLFTVQQKKFFILLSEKKKKQQKKNIQKGKNILFMQGLFIPEKT